MWLLIESFSLDHAALLLALSRSLLARSFFLSLLPLPSFSRAHPLISPLSLSLSLFLSSSFSSRCVPLRMHARYSRLRRSDRDSCSYLFLHE